MIRVIAISLFFVSTSVIAQPDLSSRSSCSSFAPAASEVEEIAEIVGSEVPGSAQLESACYTLADRQTGSIELSEVRFNHYTFYWPTDEIVGGVRFYRKARCTAGQGSASRCSTAGRFALWKGALTSFETNITSNELVELLRATEDSLPGTRAIQQVRRTYVSEAGQRFPSVRRYRLVADGAAGKHLYTLEQTCTAASNCVWGVTPEGEAID